jgi:hypothetical protein
MSLISTNLIQERIEEVALGEPTIHGQMAMFPILGEEEGTADYITLDEAISNGYARVTEIDKEGNVPELNFKNECEKRKEEFTFRKSFKGNKKLYLTMFLEQD